MNIIVIINIVLVVGECHVLLGQYAAMSILQGGNGFSFFAEPVYKYFTAGKCTGIDILNDQIPDITYSTFCD